MAAQRLTGRLVSWNDDRGFGFIDVPGRERYFVHINAIAAIATRPRVGDQMSFVAGPGRDGRPAALDVVIAGANPVLRDAQRRGLPQGKPGFGMAQFVRVVLALAILALASLAPAFGRAPVPLTAVYLAGGAIGVVAFWRDKRAAEFGRWRISEQVLHFIDLFGGIAGGLLAQALLRHKTAKPGFAAVTYAIAALHIVGLLLLLGGVFNQ